MQDDINAFDTYEMFAEHSLNRKAKFMTSMYFQSEIDNESLRIESFGRFKKSNLITPQYNHVTELEKKLLGYIEMADVSSHVPSEDAENYVERELIAALEDESLDQMGHNAKLDIGEEEA